MNEIEGVGAIWTRLRRNHLIRDAGPFAVLGGVVMTLLDAWGRRGMGPTAASLMNGVLLSVYVGGLLFLAVRSTLRLIHTERGVLRASEDRFRNLTRLSADWFWETDAEHRISWISGGAQVSSLLGEKSVYGLRLWDIARIEFQPDALAVHEERLAGRLPFFDLELTVRTASGAQHVHSLSGEPVVTAAGSFRGYRGVARDVSQQRGAERALGEAKQRLDLAVAGASLAVGDVDIERGVIYLDEGWARLLGKQAVKPETLPLAELFEAIHPDDRAAVQDTYLKTLKGGIESFGVEYRVRHAQGSGRWVNFTGRVTARGPDGRALRLTGVAIDVDARKRAEQGLAEMEQRYRSLSEASPDAILVHCGGLIEYANPAAVRLLKAGTPRALLGLLIDSLIAEERQVRERLEFVAAGPGAIPFEEGVMRALDGSAVPVESAAVSYLEGGRLLIQSVLRDLSERRRARDELAEREQRFRDIVEASGEYVWETDAALKITFLSARVEAVLGYRPGDLLGRSLYDLAPAGESDAARDYLKRKVSECAAFRNFNLRTQTRAGRVIWQSLSGLPVVGEAGTLKGYRGTGADITAGKQAEERIQFLATRDVLTGLPNRALLADRVNQAILAAARGRGQFALLILDIDRFKLINDALGHPSGDALLRAFAERIGYTLRKQDTLARLGGDEFVLLWEGLKTRQEAEMLAQRLLGVLARPFAINGRSLNACASIGISLYPEHGRDFNDLLRHADAAMYRAKELGRGTYCFFGPELSSRAGDRLSMENDLRSALQRGELQLRWQPVVRSRSAHGEHQLIGAEALVRWAHPERGMVPPDLFIPLAEECGLIRQIGEWTLERALARIGGWQRSLPGQYLFSVNVSATELAQGDAYVEHLRAALQANGVQLSARSGLELEVTERVLMAHLPENVEALQRIGALGVRIAIDDFGTGYSSLAYLRRLPVDKLKIDRSFLRELERQPADEKIVRSIAALAESLELGVAAEGVENATQLARLLALGCREWQGHYFSEPLEAEGFERLARERVRAVS